MKYLSLCLPTNGIMEWVFPVLDEIFRQDADINEYEVIVTDNGNNQEFFERIQEYSKSRSNLIYKKTNAFLFENQIEALRLATGEYLKFLNHRSILEPGSIQWMIDMVKETADEKPVIYFSNGALKSEKRQTFGSFDEFVRGVGHYASWTTGVGVWKTDFEKIPTNHVYNKISPHSDVLFAERQKEKYIIDDKIWSHDIDTSHTQKGKYDLYKTFGAEEITITLHLYIDGDISAKTLKHVIRAYENLVADFYLKFNVFHRPCSYVLDSFEDVMGIFLRKKRVLFMAYIKIPKMLVVKAYNKLRKLKNKND